MNNYKTATWYQRLIGMIIDLFIISIVTFILTSINYQSHDELNEQIFLIVFFTYYFLLEVIFNITIGKLITCTVVRSKLEYKRVSFWRIFLRSICRLIPLEALSFISKKPFGLHDQFSGTVVINSKYSYSAFYRRFKTTGEGFIRLSWVISILIGLPTFGIGFITYWLLARLVLWIQDGYSEDRLKNQQ